MKNAEKIAACIISILILFSLSACGGKKSELTDESGQMLRLHLSEISDTGFFVMDRRDHMFTPVMSGADGYQGEGLLPADDTGGRFLWCGDKDADLKSLIPQVDGKNTFLVIYQTGENEMPESYSIEKYKDLGYTLGVSVSFGETGGSLFLVNDDLCSSSMAEDILSDCTSGLLKIHKINGKKDLPLDNVDTEVEKLLGLEKDKRYQVGFFDGTTYHEEEFLADTAVFKSEKVMNLENPLKPTEHGFFYVKLPVNLKNGYYHINDAGLFRYTGQQAM